MDEGAVAGHQFFNRRAVRLEKHQIVKCWVPGLLFGDEAHGFGPSVKTVLVAELAVDATGHVDT